MPPIRERLPFRQRRQRFWTVAPAHRNALRLLSGEWASNLAEIEPGELDQGPRLFKLDARPRQSR